MDRAKAYSLSNSKYLQEKLTKSDELTQLAIAKLDNRFKKIESTEYYLSYSGGNDSEIVRRYIEFRRLPIKVVAVNTYREHVEIKDRMYKYSDVVVYPTKTFDEINKEYGMPCFSKNQDEFIKRYQRGSRSENTMKRVARRDDSQFKLSKLASELTLSGKLHKVSGECCEYTKKMPLKQYEKKTGLKAIVCVRRSESLMREAKYTSCLTDQGKFTPIFDFPKELMSALEDFFEIIQPDIYKKIDRTGCIGCPYGKRNTEIELSCVTPAQKKFAVDSFKKSYDVLGIDYTNTQLHIFDIIEGE